MKEKQFIIGVTPCHDEEGVYSKNVDYYYLRKEYTSVFNKLGATVVIIPEMSEVNNYDFLSGLVITGGEDIPADFYGKQNPPGFKLEPRRRIEFELKLIEMCIQNKIPILGICYGMQLLNIYFGGNLIPDLGAIGLDHNFSDPKKRHIVKLCEDSWLKTCFPARDDIEVCSRHHQAIDKLSDDFKASSYTNDGLIEAIEHKTIPEIIACQWHPESDETGLAIYTYFLNICLDKIINPS